MDSWRFLFAALVFILGVHGGETQSSTEDKLTSAQGQCVQPFRHGREDFVLDTEESIEDGAVFLSNPSVAHRNACIAACCRDPRCNLALIEDGYEKGPNNSCFLFNCLYKQKYVCRFIQKKGFTNYILDSVYEYYLNGRKSAGKDKPPIANAGRDVVVQPNEEVLLNGIESWDDRDIISYEWILISGDESVRIEKTDLPDQVKVSKLVPGVYKFKLTVTDSAHHSDSAQVTLLVLTPEQSERHCLAPKKVGPCRGSFPRWHYNAASSKCEKFIFGGCKENNNNYLSEQECLNACKNTTVIPGDTRKLPKEDCTSSCGEDKFKCSNGCCVKKELECDEQQQCSDSSDEENCEQLTNGLTRLLGIEVNKKAHCTDPAVVGPCRASFPRWYYDPLNKKCHRFTYGGCDGNENNFETSDKCMDNCSGVTENDVFARGLYVREPGEELGESQSASVALAVVLVVAILAILAVLGYFFLKNKRKSHQPVATSSPPVVYSDNDQQLVYNSTTAKA
ncbi:kunitz-type protease inhibitor 1b [Sinocyclocheilus anshuiensis]|uniref:Serine peptidase inhibitor, Kunitz type 1 a n=1 Tax=Sinocyclocheilus anshuiensis TaxID=1608454 RepID=A0A671QLE4_9TELE|nr:PREDICTED: kunitz-type protease inhibitor 1 [Sinocyclocheilus anshuiensis]